MVTVTVALRALMKQDAGRWPVLLLPPLSFFPPAITIHKSTIPRN
jgi:hypothetical protein